MEWFFKCWRHYADFSGRARRQEYWMFTLFNVLTYLGLSIVGGVLLGAVMGLGNLLDSQLFERIASVFGIVMAVVCWGYLLAALVPSLAAAVRRLHDTGNSGWMLLVGLIPLVGSIWLLVLYCQDSQPGPNAWGENPKA